ncbi:MAG: hypothetical protein J6Q82_06855 [Clostridia bacterium]|nr:hypothetical protein [Clostridia bacterium]
MTLAKQTVISKTDNGGNRCEVPLQRISPAPLQDDFGDDRRRTSTNRLLSLPDRFAYYFSSTRFATFQYIIAHSLRQVKRKRKFFKEMGTNNRFFPSIEKGETPLVVSPRCIFDATSPFRALLNDCGALPHTPLKNFLKKVLKNLKNF